VRASMNSSVFSRFQKRRRDRVGPSGGEGPLSDRKRAGQVVLAARERLRPFAELEDLRMTKHQTLVMKTGFVDGIGALMQISSFDLRPDGSLSEAEYARFVSENAELVEGGQSALLNYAVLSSLLMTIFVSLIVVHSSRGYEVDGPTNGVEAFGEDAAERGMYADFATFVYADDLAARQTLRRVFYWLESVILVIGFSMQTFGLLKSTFLYALMSVGLPSVVAKCEFTVGNPTLMGEINNAGMRSSQVASTSYTSWRCRGLRRARRS
jgi:hypothetical protein